jgi:ribosomal protein S12 methylthiotransferase accessory factor YcaO
MPIDPTPETIMLARVYAFLHQTDAKGTDGFSRLVAWVAEQEEKVQASFATLLDGATREKLTEKMGILADEMKAAGMDPVAEATTAATKVHETLIPVERLPE